MVPSTKSGQLVGTERDSVPGEPNLKTCRQVGHETELLRIVALQCGQMRDSPAVDTRLAFIRPNHFYLSLEVEC
jgi:hypothetical protein